MKLRNKFAIPPIFILLLVMSVYLMIFVVNENKKNKIELSERVELYINLISKTSIAGIWDFDTEALEQSLDLFISDKIIRNITLKAADGEKIAEKITVNKDNIPMNKIQVYERKIIQDDELVGFFEASFTSYYFDRKVIQGIYMMILAIISIVLIMFFAIIETGIIVTKPLILMTGFLEKVSKKDFTQTLLVKSKDEIGVVAKTISEVIEILKNSIIEMSNKASNLTAISENLAAASEEGFRSNESMRENLIEIEDKVNLSVNEVEEINNKMNEQEKFLIENSENSEKALEKTKSTIENVKNGVEIVDNVAVKMNEVNDKVELTTEMIKKLAFLLGKIDDFSKKITEISSQTNLLALNAAIEAARAGEAGKGFAVVASEVKKLAEESNMAAEEIGKMVKDVKEETQNSVNSMNETYKIVIENKDDLIKTTKVLKSINNESIEMAKTIEEIFDSLKLQNSNQNMMKLDIENIFNNLEHNSREVKNIVYGVGENLGSMKLVAEASAEVVDNAEELSVLVAEFKIKADDHKLVQEI